MEAGELLAAEQLVWHAFPLGRVVDLSDEEDRRVRADVIRSLLLGANPAVAGHQPRLLLKSATIDGKLALAYAEIACPIELHECTFNERLDLYGAHLGHLSLRGSQFPGLIASYCVISGNLRLRECRSTSTIHMIGTVVAGSILLDSAQLSAPDVAWSGTNLHVEHDVVAQNGFVCRGEINLADAEIGGALRWEGAQLINPGGRALFAPEISVGAMANMCTGFRSEGSIRLSHARISSRLCFDNAEIIGPGDAALILSHVQAHELVLQPAKPIVGNVDLSHARIGVLLDDPRTWPTSLQLNGLRYDTLTGIDTSVDRLAWLHLDPSGYQPQPYEQLAEMYRISGRDREARTVLLAKQRHQRETAAPIPKTWGYAQDLIVGYGYRPTRAATTLLVLLTIGTVAFAAHPPRSTTSAPEFNPFMYTLDLLLPLVDFGLQGPYQPAGAHTWLMYALIAAGWILATTVAAGISRVLRR